MNDTARPSSEAFLGATLDYAKAWQEAVIQIEGLAGNSGSSTWGHLRTLASRMVATEIEQARISEAAYHRDLDRGLVADLVQNLSRTAIVQAASFVEVAGIDPDLFKALDNMVLARYFADLTY